MRSARMAVWSMVLGTLGFGAGAPTMAVEVPVQFRDSATGLAIQPERIDTRWLATGITRTLSRSQSPADGRATLSLEAGRHLLTATAANYRPMSGELDAGGSPFRTEFHLDPLELPIELRPETLR